MVTEMKRIASLVVLCALLMTGFASMQAPVLADGHGSDYPYPGTGDWNITGYTYVGNETVVLNGNLTIKNGGHLYLFNATISINNPSTGKYGVNITSGGKLTAIGSTFKGPTMPPPYNYTFFADVGSNVTLTKCTFENAGYKDNDLRRQGIVIASQNPSISDTTFRKGYSGLILMGSKNVTLSSLRFENNTQIGLFQIQTENIVVEDSNATGNMAGFAMYMSKSATLRRSESNTNVFGAMLVGSQKARVNSFNIYNAFMGVLSEVSGNSTIGPFVNVTYSQNGIFLNSSRDSTVIGNNIISATDGIYLNNSHSNKVLLNTVKSSLDKGIVLIRSSKNEIGRNTILSTAGASKIVGIDLEDSSNNRVHNNTVQKMVAQNEDVKGIFLLRSNNNTLYLNKIEGLSALRYLYGIIVQESSYNYIAKNSAVNVSASSPTGNILFPWYAIGIIVWEKSSWNAIVENTVTNVTTKATFSYSIGIIVGTLFGPENNNTASKNIVSIVNCFEGTASAFGIMVVNKADYTNVRENKIDDVSSGPGVAYGMYIDNVIETQLSKNTVSKVVAGISGKAYGFYYKNVNKASMNGDLIKGVAFGPQAMDAFLIYLENSKSIDMESVSVQGGGVGIGLYKGSTDVTSANMTFQTIAKESIHVLEKSNLTVLNTTFDKFSITPGSTLRVQNFLHVKVVDAKDDPLKGMRVSVRDNKLEIANQTTDAQGLVRWIVAMNRIYFGDTNPKYNKTNARVLTTGNIYDKHPRDANMNTSHTETFKVTGTVIDIGFPSYRTGVNDTWNVSQATKFTLSINYSGPSTIFQYFAIGSGQYTKYTTPFNLSGLSGAVKINFYSSDGSVNIENPHNLTVNLDATPPTTSYSIVGARFGTDPVYVSPSSKISLKSTDAGGSGCAKSYYSIDKVGWIEYKGPVELKNLSEGAHIFQYYSTDNIGNKEVYKGINLSIDATPPTTNLTVGTPKYGTSPTYISEKTRMTLNASDSASGVLTMYYILDGLNLSVSGGSIGFYLTENGSHTLKFYAIDRVGNVEVLKSFDFIVDALSPKADAGGDRQVDSGSIVTLSGKASHDNVKVVNWTWVITSPSNAKLTLYGDEVQFTPSETGDYSVNLTVTDEVGHSGSDLIKISAREKGTGAGSGLLFLLLIIILAVVVGAVIWYRVLRQKKEREELEAKKEEDKKAEKKAEPEPEKKEETRAKEERAEGMKEATPAIVAAVAGATTEKEITAGMNNLVLTSDIKWCYDKFKELMSEGAKGLCISTTQPAKLRIRYKVREASLYWLTDSSAEKDTLNPRRIEFEVTKTLLEFMKTNKGGVMFIDGLEYLIMENGFERVTRFIKKIGDSASKGEQTLIILLNPSALAPDPLTIMKKNFDEVIEK